VGLPLAEQEGHTGTWEVLGQSACGSSGSTA
jgi:hypothetical protein